MTNSIRLSGMGVALVTPFTPQNTIDFPALGRLIDYQIEGGASFIVVLGTTAETPTLTPAERQAVQEFVASHVNGRVPLVLGKGGNNTAALIEDLRTSDLTGYSAILSVAPYYNKPTQQGLYSHFNAIADASPLPVILYNVPGRTGVNLSAATTLALALHPRIIAIKEASGSVTQAAEIAAKAPEDFFVLSGDDALTLPLIGVGATGVISVLGNAYPRRFSRLVNDALSGHAAAARTAHHLFGPLYRLLFAEGNPAGIKSALAAMELLQPGLRLPLTPVSEATDTAIRQFVQEVSDNYQK